MFMTLVRISKIYTFLELRSLGQNHSQQLSTTKPQLLVPNCQNANEWPLKITGLPR